MDKDSAEGGGNISGCREMGGGKKQKERKLGLTPVAWRRRQVRRKNYSPGLNRKGRVMIKRGSARSREKREKM